jgi:hypothetical protein
MTRPTRSCQVKADARLAELEATADAILVLADGATDAARELRKLLGVRAVESSRTPDGQVYRVQASGKADLRPAIYSLAREQNWPLKELRRDVRTLEMVFNELVTTTEKGHGGAR